MPLQEETTGQGDTGITCKAQEGDAAQMSLARELEAMHAQRQKLQAELKVRMCPHALGMCLRHISVCVN